MIPRISRAVVAVVVTVMVAAGCAGEGDSGGEATQSTESSLRAPAPDPSVDDPKSPTEPSEPSPSATGQSDLLPNEKVQKIDWEAVSDHASVPPQRVPESLRETYAASPVPVLLPPDSDALASTTPTVGEHWYAASLDLEGRHLAIRGTRVARDMPDLEPAEGEFSKSDFNVVAMHGIVAVSFTSFGVAYTLEVECAETDERGRCESEDFAIDVAERLAVLEVDR